MSEHLEISEPAVGAAVDAALAAVRVTTTVAELKQARAEHTGEQSVLARMNASMRSVPPVGMAWQAFNARFRNAWRSIAGSALTSMPPSHSNCTWTPDRSASGRTMGITSAKSAISVIGCSFRSSGRVNLRNP